MLVILFGKVSLAEVGVEMKFFGKSSGGVSADDINSANDVVLAITSTLKSGADQQEIASKRIASLGKTIAKMQSSLRQLDRVQAENTRLSSELKDAQDGFEKKRAWAEEQSSQLLAVKTQRDKVQNELKIAKADLARLRDQDAANTERLRRQKVESDALRAASQNQEERLEMTGHSARKLQEELTQAQTARSAQMHKLAELENAVEELTGRLESKTLAADDASAALQEIRMERNALKDEMIVLRGALQTAEYELESKGGMHTEAIARRNKELIALKSQSEQLSAQLRIKADMNTHYEAEITSLRQALSGSREEARAHEQRLQASSHDETRNFSALSEAKRDYEQLNAKFVEALKDIEALRGLTQMQRAKLDRYADLNGSRVSRPDLPEAIRPRREDTPMIRPKAVNE